MAEPFAYVAGWTKRRSTARLKADLAATMRQDCECDGYSGFECGKHRRSDELRWALAVRNPLTPGASHDQ